MWTTRGFRGQVWAPDTGLFYGRPVVLTEMGRPASPPFLGQEEPEPVENPVGKGFPYAPVAIGLAATGILVWALS